MLFEKSGVKWRRLSEQISVSISGASATGYAAYRRAGTGGDAPSEPARRGAAFSSVLRPQGAPDRRPPASPASRRHPGPALIVS